MKGKVKEGTRALLSLSFSLCVCCEGCDSLHSHSLPCRSVNPYRESIHYLLRARKEATEEYFRILEERTYEQCGLRCHHDCTDMIFAVQQYEMFEQLDKAFFAFVDLKKAHESPWGQFVGCPCLAGCASLVG